MKNRIKKEIRSYGHLQEKDGIHREMHEAKMSNKDATIHIQ